MLVIFFIIPLLLLIYNLTQSPTLAILVLLFSAGITYTLYPKNNVNPIAGGVPLSKSLTNCVNSNWEYVIPLNWGKEKCGTEHKNCVDSGWSYVNPFNWGKGKC